MRSGGAKNEPIGVVPTTEAAETQSPEMSLDNKQSPQALMFPSSFKKQMVFHEQDAIMQIQRSYPYSRQLLPSKRQIRGSEIQLLSWQHKDVYSFDLLWLNDQLEVV